MSLSLADNTVMMMMMIAVQEFSAYTRPGAAVTLSYRLAGREVLQHEANLLKHQENLYKMLLIRPTIANRFLPL
jgi:hypothetical protein